MTMNMKLREYREEGYNLGHEDGLSQGRSEGFAQGSHDKAVETAKKMLKFGDSIDKISAITDLPVEEIQNLK